MSLRYTVLELFSIQCSSCSVYSVTAVQYTVWQLFSIQCYSCSVYSVAAVQYLQFVLHVMLFRSWNLFCTFTTALPAVCVQCTIWLFLQFINVVLSRYVVQVLSDCFEMVPAVPVVTGITFVFTFHTRWISVMRSLHFEIFTASFLITFLSPGIATSIDTHVPCLLSRLWYPVYC